MTITIEKNINKETLETWGFNLFDLTAVFVLWQKWEKPKGKRKWTLVSYWNKYEENRRVWQSTEEPPLSDSIKAEVAEEIGKRILVKSWKEWKGI